ncbi:MAG: hypothetical protein QHI38_07945, partial [Armatimonadota bacterium]|nr:hypothetical protein [Armatimonadota bacterium]
EQGKFRIRGDYGRLIAAAVADAKLVFHNRERFLEHRYSIPSPELMLAWWQLFKGMEVELARAGRAEEALAAQYIRTKVLEPAYNFRGIEARSIAQEALPAALLLVFYLVFALWYGFSVLLLLDGLGISKVGHRGSGSPLKAG